MTTLAAQVGVAHPPSTPEAGFNDTTFRALWSGDEDGGNLSADASAMRALAAATDVPFDAPPEAVERWNREAVADWPDSGPAESRYPSHATREQGTTIKDAYVELVAINPSTRTWFSPNATPQYVAPNGTVLGVVDYRVALPDDDERGSRRVSWRLRGHRIVGTELTVDGATESFADGTPRPALVYSSLDAYPGSTHILTLRTTIEVELERTVRTRDRDCRDIENETTCRTRWDASVSRSVESITVSDQVTVTTYDLDIGGVRGRYPDGDLGLVVYIDRPWLGYTLPVGAVRGVWRFYSARDPSWDTVVVANGSGSTTVHSPLHPLTVNAYPFEPGPTVSPRQNLTLIETYGTSVDPPGLPEPIQLDVMTEPYVASYGLVTRAETGEHDLSAVAAHGLVRGVTVPASESRFVDVPINRSELSLTVLTVTPEAVTVSAHLVDAETREPIETRGRDGYVEIGGERAETNASGSVEVTLPRRSGGVTARYVPGPWWVHETGYVGDSTIVEVRGTASDPLSSLFRIGLPVSLLLIAVVIVDRLTGWRLWPPWRGL